MIINQYAAFGRLRIGRGNRNSRRKPSPVPPGLPQIPREVASDRTRSAAAGSMRLTASAMSLLAVVYLIYFLVTWLVFSLLSLF
jgi:hypothetical protein